MAAKILTSIPPLNFEVIRDNVVAILQQEFVNQHTLNNAYPNVTKVWCERCIPFNSETQLPTINVNLAKGQFSNRNAIRADGSYLLNIDCYTMATTNATTGPADQYAMIRMTKMMGMVWSILSNQAYLKLNTTGGIMATMPMIEQFAVLDKSQVDDALSNSIGRVQLRFTVVENTITGSGVPLESNFTHVHLEESDEGFYYEFNAEA